MDRALEKVDILDSLPPVIKSIDEIKAIAHTENKELNELYKILYNLMSDQFVYTATEVGIRRWEKMLGVIPSGDLESRRFTILNHLNVRIPYTWKMINERMRSMFGDKYSMSFNNDTTTLELKIPIGKMVETRNMLEVICPANIVIDIKEFK